MNGSEALVRMLEELDVEVIFGLCGDTSLPFYEALHDLDHSIRHVLTRDERGASFMADAYARFSGRVGICEGPSGGGATYILPGVAEANGSAVPVVCFTSDIDARERGKGTLTELDQAALFDPVTRSSFYPTHAAELPRFVRDAFRAATTGGLGAAHVALPFNVQSEEVVPSEVYADARSGRYPADRTRPDPARVKEAATRLLESRRPVLVAGAGVIRSAAWEELAGLARILGAPVATSIPGKGSIAETDPLALGVVGSNGGLPYRHRILEDADLVFFVGGGTGSVTTEKWTRPAPGDATILQLDPDPGAVGRSYRVAVGLVADAKLGLAALSEELRRRGEGEAGDRTDPEEIRRGRERHMEEAAELFESDAVPIRPERFLTELLGRIPRDGVVLADPGTPCPYLSAYHRLPEAGRWFVSPRAHGALGYALPGVVGAHFARPDAGRVIGVMGDGSFGVAAGDLETLARLALPVTLIVLSNAGYGWIKAGQKQLGGKYYSVDFSDADYATVARGFGVEGRRIVDPGELEDGLAEALTSTGPFLLDVKVQPLHEARAPVSKWIA